MYNSRDSTKHDHYLLSFQYKLWPYCINPSIIKKVQGISNKHVYRDVHDISLKLFQSLIFPGKQIWDQWKSIKVTGVRALLIATVAIARYFPN